LDGSIIAHINGLTTLYQKAEAVANIFWKKYPRSEDRETLFREEHIVVDDVEGTLDEMELYIPNGQTTLRDTKTTGRALDAILTGYSYGLQLRVYRYLAEDWCRKNGYAAPLGFIVDSVLMPTIKLCGKDVKRAKTIGCTPEEAYITRVEEWYEENGKKAMASTPMRFNEPLMTEELDDAFETIRELSNRDPKPTNYKRDVTKSYCYAYENVCPYYSLCDMKCSMWPVELDQHFEVWETEQKGEL
jgi:hypothetical protein